MAEDKTEGSIKPPGSDLLKKLHKDVEEFGKKDKPEPFREVKDVITGEPKWRQGKSNQSTTTEEGDSFRPLKDLKDRVKQHEWRQGRVDPNSTWKPPTDEASHRQLRERDQKLREQDAAKRETSTQTPEPAKPAPKGPPTK